MPDLIFNAKAKSENPTKTMVETSCFKLTIDEPESLGGTNDGANPVQYLLASLGGCLNVMGHLIAKEMNFNLKCLEINMEGDLNPAKLFGQQTEDRAGYKEIRVIIKPDADADRETLEKWLNTIESRCPVNDNLTNPTPVKISLG
jgi:uncharacterized OsmC-like protein